MADSTMHETSAVPALTTLTEEEQMFRASVRQFAQEKVKPLAKQMGISICS